MIYTNQLLSLPEYQSILSTLEKIESDRIFCRHNLSHFLDVARICKLILLENNIPASDDCIYLTSLLHDVGRISQNKNHKKASVDIAKNLLEKINYPIHDRKIILTAIAEHGFRGKHNPVNFTEAFSLADNISRACYHCSASQECYWPESRKNHNITY